MSELKNVRHCRYCQNHEFKLNEGIICTLTGQKGEFSNTCPKVNFGDNLYTKIFDVNIAVEYLHRLKPKSYIYLVTFLTLGIAVHILNYVLTIHIYEKGFLSTITITILILGVILMGMGIGAIRFYIVKKNIILPKKEELDQIVKLYNLQYEFTTKIKSDILGNENAASTLKIDGKTIKRDDNIAMLATTR